MMTFDEFTIDYFRNPLTQKCVEDLQRFHNFTEQEAQAEVIKASVQQAYIRYQKHEA